MHPVILLAGVVGAGLGIKYYHDKQVQADADRAKAYQQIATELQQGKTYAIQFMLDPKAKDWPQLTDKVQAAAFIKSGLQQLGWKPLSDPTLRNDDAIKAFLAGDPSEWIFNAQWNRPEKYLAGGFGWLGMALPYLLPTQ